ncbi:MAG: hypothetical protein E7258_05285 [Lachnospiraceae bacterium]|nr:hypothetical protein [Lachnospiraceae bacterium]
MNILEAVNETQGTNFKTLEEMTDYFTYNEIIDMTLTYEGFIGYSYSITNLFETFYMLIPKETNKL